MRRLRLLFGDAPSLEGLVTALFAVLGAGLGASSISDNSMLLHMRTGGEIFANGAIPRADPFSFTAPGAEWTVQSWLPAWTYGWLGELGDDLDISLILVEQSLLMAAAAWFIARLARTGQPFATAVTAAAALGVGIAFWTPRPYLFALVCFALTVVVVERGKHPALLIPITWVWVNSHGSFALGAIWIGASMAGMCLDERRIRLDRDRLRYFGTFLAGMLIGALNPLGWRLLTFPFTAGEKREVFRSIREWGSPDFQTTSGFVTLVALAVVLMLLARGRTPWRLGLPAIGFVLMGLIALRNLPMASVAIAPALGASLATLSRERREDRRLNRLFAGVVAAIFVVFVVKASGAPVRDFESYPRAAVSWLDDNGYLVRRVAHQDVVGCYIINRYGTKAKVFIDDRIDMYPVGVTRDYRDLLNGRGRPLATLDRYRIDAVLWDEDLPLSKVLDASPGWRRTHLSDGWAVYIRA